MTRPKTTPQHGLTPTSKFTKRAFFLQNPPNLLMRLLRRAYKYAECKRYRKTVFEERVVRSDFATLRRSCPFPFGIPIPPPIFRDYVMNNLLSPEAMKRVGRPFEGRKRNEARRQARIDKNRAGPKEVVRYTISVRKNSREWSLLEPQENRSEFIRKIVREYPTHLRTIRDLKAEIAEYETQVKMLREYQQEFFRLREIVDAHSIEVDA